MEVICNKGLPNCIEIKFDEHSYMLTPSDAMRLKKMLGEAVDCLLYEEQSNPTLTPD